MLTIAALVIVALVMYRAGYSEAVGKEGELYQTNEQLQRQVQQLTQENADLRATATLLQRTQQVEAEASAQVQGRMRDLQAEILELQEEVTFYRAIITPSETATGIRIQRFEITPLAESGMARYQLVLTQVLKDDTVTRGEVDIDIQGVHEGRPKMLPVAELLAKKTGPLKFSFKYFQKFEGDLLLPPGFLPHSIEVNVRPASGNSIKESFKWPNGLVKST
ncbi:MAG: DUF6776 family protein [Pseudomonadota bacterium]